MCGTLAARSYKTEDIMSKQHFTATCQDVRQEVKAQAMMGPPNR